MIKAFIHYSDAAERDACVVLTTKFGDKGYAVWFRLLEFINQHDGNILDLSSESNMILAASYCNPASPMDTRIREFIEILDFCASHRGTDDVPLIDPVLWTEKKVLNPKNMDNIIKILRKKKPSERKVDPSSKEYRFAQIMFKDIGRVVPALKRASEQKMQKSIEAWAVEISKMPAMYNTDYTEMYKVWRWLHDSMDNQAKFWRKVIQSGGKFSLHYPRLEAFYVGPKEEKKVSKSPFSGGLVA